MVAAAQLPRLGAHLRDEGVHPTMFCSHWFITLFAYTLPFGALSASLKGLHHAHAAFWACQSSPRVLRREGTLLSVRGVQACVQSSPKPCARCVSLCDNVSVLAQTTCCACGTSCSWMVPRRCSGAQRQSHTRSSNSIKVLRLAKCCKTMWLLSVHGLCPWPA